MMHFRTLDWNMPELRDVIVQFQYVRNPGGQIVARTVSYVGFVGVLTCVRKGLSASINSRPSHNDDASLLTNIKFCFQQLAVLRGFRQSIASLLRDFIIPRTKPPHDENHDIFSPRRIQSRPHYSQHATTSFIPRMPSTSAYLISCTSKETIILEKDSKTANILTSSSFITTTNHNGSYDTSQHYSHPCCESKQKNSSLLAQLRNL
jgi:hypothetical protein